MADREKVVKGLEEAETMLIQAVDRGGEMAVMGAFKCLNRVTDALELLKEQEPVHVQKRELAHMWFWCCGSCGVAITKGDKFCRMCGKSVKWEEQHGRQEVDPKRMA